MKYLIRALLIAAATLPCFTNMVMATELNDPNINIHQAWAHSTAPGQNVGAAYLMIVSKKDTTIVSVKTDAADHTQIHSMTMDNGVMKMRELESLPIPAGKMISLAPGSMHLMLLGLKKPLKAGEQLTLTLQFKDHAGTLSSVTIKVPIQAEASEHEQHSM